MKFDENLAAVHAYLCADGYVIRNPPEQKKKYYYIGFRNTNLTLLKDFQNKFYYCFGIKPHLIKGQRCTIGSKEIYEKLTKEFGSFYSWEWKMPKLSDKLAKIWLRAYFDCEGWVFCKSHQNRHIGVDCVNTKGLSQVEKVLNKLNITTIRKFNSQRKIHRIVIYGKDNLLKFKEKIGFLHPEKAGRLRTTLNDFMVYEWAFPKDKNNLRKFVQDIMNQKAKINQRNGVIRVISNKINNLLELQKNLQNLFEIESKVNERRNGTGTVYFEMNVNKQAEVKKLINNNLLNKEERLKWLKLKS